MPESSKMGNNRTGIATSPKLSKEMIDGVEKIQQTSKPNGVALSAKRKSYIAEAGRLGSVPVPASFKGALTTAKDKLAGHKPEVFIDKLGERLAFERGGVRLYELFIAKCESMPDSGIPLDDVRHIQQEEDQHFRLVQGVMQSIGADPTAETPAADASGVASMGLIQVLSDPRTSIAQGLEAILTAELVDNAGWELLIELAEGLGMTDAADQFRSAFKEEGEHLSKVKGWLQQVVLQESGA